VRGAPSPADALFARDGLTGDAAGAIYEDREGDIWVGTEAGVDRFAPANVVTETGISVRGQTPLVDASPAAVYVADGWSPPVLDRAHPVERIYRIAGGKPVLLPVNIGNVVAIDPEDDDALFLGASGARLFELRGGVLSPIELPAAARGAGLQSVAAAGEDLWVAIDGHGVFRRRRGVWSPYATPGIPPNVATTLSDEQRGTVWIVGANGALVGASGDRQDAIAAAPGPNLGETHAFVPDGQGGVLLGGWRGVSRFDGRTFHTLTMQQAPFLAWTVGIAPDSVGGTWFMTLSGIYRVATGQLQRAFLDPRVRLDYQLFDARDGLRSLPTSDVFGSAAKRGPDGRIWFMTLDGVAWLDPSHLYRNRTPPPVSIQSLNVHGRAVDPSAATTLAAGTSAVQINYTALSLQNPDRISFRYRLDGVDNAWIDAGARRQAFYTRLGPGHYRFRVIAANNDGVWNTTGARLDFEIPPTFVQSGWFLLLCAVLAALILWLAYTWRVRQVTAAVQSRLEERVAERERIARELHDTLLQGFQGLILRLHAVMQALPSSGAARAQMEAALERADEVLISGRDRVRQLRTRGGGDLADALAATAEAAAEGSSASFRLVVEGTARSLDPMVAEELIAIGREAILNAFQHSSARSIDAVLTYERRALLLRIADDGVGIDANVAERGRAGHFGLTGMRERAAKIEAGFSISSRPGAGSEISISVPARVAYAASADQPLVQRWLRAALARGSLLYGAPRRP
jgi:signal transduction histidine kinase